MATYLHVCTDVFRYVEQEAVGFTSTAEIQQASMQATAQSGNPAEQTPPDDIKGIEEQPKPSGLKQRFIVQFLYCRDQFCMFYLFIRLKFRLNYHNIVTDPLKGCSQAVEEIV